MRDHAIVIGGSIGGLLAADVLTDHFARVTIVDRDVLPEDPTFRKGVPHSRFVHALFKRGWVLLDQRFPTLAADLLAAGAVNIKWCQEMVLRTPGGWSERQDFGMDGISCSRELLEWCIRRHVKANSRVQFVTETEVIGLTTTADKSRVTGVRTRSRGEQKQPAPEQLTADLVIDVSGRDSKAPKWLEELGYAPPEETTTDAHLRYVCRYFETPKGLPWKALFMPASPPKVRQTMALACIEGNRIIGGIVAPEGEHAPQDDDAFLEHARKLHDPYFHEVIKSLKPLTPLVGYQRTKNHLRHYDKLKRMPEQFMVMGDAMCGFNPIYGQGITVLMLQSVVLEACMKEHRSKRPDGDLTGLNLFFQKQLAKSVALPWQMAFSEDLRYPNVEGPKPSAAIRFGHWYFDRMLPFVATDPEISRTFMHVLHLMAPWSELFKPGTVFKVLFGKPTPGLTRPPGVTPADQWGEEPNRQTG